MTQPRKNPNNLGYKVSSRNYMWRDLAVRAWGSEFSAPDKGIYEFSYGRMFDSTDQSSNGYYNGGDIGE